MYKTYTLKYNKHIHNNKHIMHNTYTGIVYAYTHIRQSRLADRGDVFYQTNRIFAKKIQLQPGYLYTHYTCTYMQMAYNANTQQA